MHYTIDQLNAAANASEPLSPVKLALLGTFLFNTRLIMQAMVETSTPADIVQHMTYTPSISTEEGSMDQPQPVDLCFPLLSSICSFINRFATRLDATNHLVYQEALKLLVTLMGTQLGSSFGGQDSNISHRQVFLDALCLDVTVQEARFGDSINVSELMSVLLNHVIAQKRYDVVDPTKAPTVAPVAPASPKDLESGPVTEPPASNSAWSAFVEIGQFFAFPFQEFARMLVTGDTAIPVTFSSLGELSICPVLVLVTHQTVDGQNPYRNWLASLGSTSSPSDPSDPSTPASMTPSSSSSSVPLLKLSGITNAKVPSFAALYKCITTRISGDSMLVLLYVLLQNNAEFHRFIASRADLDLLLLPLLEYLYRAHEHTRVRVYTILILLTILTFDDHFVPAMQSVTINTPRWFKETYLAQLPVPELILLVLLRTLQLNLKALHDPYLHDNCLACLGNLAGQLTTLKYFYSAKMLVQTTNLFIGRYSSLLGKSTSSIRGTSSASLGSAGSDTSPRAAPLVASSTPTLPSPAEDGSVNLVMDPDLIDSDGSQTGAQLMTMLQDMESYISTFLEILDVMTHKKPSKQVHLIYAIVLDDKSFLQVILSHPRLGELAQQLLDFSEHFLRQIQNGECENPAQVVSQISSSAKAYPESDQLADIKFAYQETNAAPFFTPFIWKLFLQRSIIYWNPTCITLYSAESQPNFDDDEEPPSRDSISL